MISHPYRKNRDTVYPSFTPISDTFKFIKNKKRNSYRNELKPMTLVIGMHYNNGVVILSDSRIMRGPDYRTEQKMFPIGDKIIISSSGLSDGLRQLIDSIQKVSSVGADFISVRRTFENSQRGLYYWYKGGVNPILEEDVPMLQAIVGTNIGDKPNLFILHERGFSEEINNCRAVGDGSRHAQNILKTLYRENISKDRAIQIGVHTIIQTASIDAVVDSSPQIAVIEKDKCVILNYDDKDSFCFNKPEIMGIKSKINGIVNKQSKIFELMLDGKDETKEKFIKLLEDYDRERETPSSSASEQSSCL